MRRVLLWSLVVAIACCARGAIAAPPGFAFLEVPTGARSAALGGAYASLASGADAAFWNPAALTSAHGMEITAAHAELFDKLRHDAFAVAGQLFGGGMSASIRALYTEPIDERDDAGNLIGSFGAHNLELALGYGRSMGEDLAVGGTASIVRERIADEAAMTYAFGGGVTWQPAALGGARVAVSAQNLGPAAHYTFDGVRGEPVGLPAAVQAGISYGTGLGSRLHVAGALEARATRGRNAIGLAGAELSDPSGAALRVGVRANDNTSTMSFGAGYAFSKLTLDYAFVPLRLDLGDTHRFALSARF